jgi:hypothetical protein
VGFFDLVVGESGEALLNEGANVGGPQEVDYFLVGQNGVGEGGSTRQKEKSEERDRAFQVQGPISYPSRPDSNQGRGDAELLPAII